MASEGELTGLPWCPDGESLAVIATVEAAVPMEVVPVGRLQLPGEPELESRPMYAEVVAGLQVTDLRTTPLDMSVEGALIVEAISSGGLPNCSAEVTLAHLGETNKCANMTSANLLGR